MDFFTIIRYIFQILTTLIGIISFYLIVRKNKKISYILTALYPLLIGGYTLTVSIYTTFQEQNIILIFLPMGMIFLTFALMFIYFSINIMAHGIIWFKRYTWILYLILNIAYAIYLYVIDYITITSIVVENTNVMVTTVDTIPLVICIAICLYFSLFSLMQLTSSTKTTRIKYVIASLLMNFFSSVSVILQNTFFDIPLFDILFYACILASSLFLLKSCY